MDLGWQELVIILVVVLIIFGAGKLPEIGSSLGKGMREFRHAAENTAEPLSDTRPTLTATTSATATTEEL